MECLQTDFPLTVVTDACSHGGAGVVVVGALFVTASTTFDGRMS